MTPKQWQRFLETGEAKHGAVMYQPWPDPRWDKGSRVITIYWLDCEEYQKLRLAGFLCRTATEADQLAGVMLAAAREWREKR